MSGTTITIDGNYNESNLILSSGSASIHSADSVPAAAAVTETETSYSGPLTVAGFQTTFSDFGPVTQPLGTLLITKKQSLDTESNVFNMVMTKTMPTDFGDHTHKSYKDKLDSEGILEKVTARFDETGKNVGFDWLFRKNVTMQQAEHYLLKDPLSQLGYYKVSMNKTFLYEVANEMNLFAPRYLKDIYYGQFFSYLVDPNVGIIAKEWTDETETESYTKQLTVMGSAKIVDVSNDACFSFETPATFEHRPAFPTPGSPTKNMVPLFATSTTFLAAKKVQEQLGLDAFITTHDSGSLVEAYLKWNIVIDGPNKNTAYYTFKLDLSSSTLVNSTGLQLKDGSVFDEATSGGGVFARIKSQALAGTADTSATYLDKEAAADLIDWSTAVPDFWAFNVVYREYFVRGGNTVTQDETNPYIWKVELLPMKFHTKYSDDPEYAN